MHKKLSNQKELISRFSPSSSDSESTNSARSSVATELSYLKSDRATIGSHRNSAPSQSEKMKTHSLLVSIIECSDAMDICVEDIRKRFLKKKRPLSPQAQERFDLCGKRLGQAIRTTEEKVEDTEKRLTGSRSKEQKQSKLTNLYMLSKLDNRTANETLSWVCWRMNELVRRVHDLYSRASLTTSPKTEDVEALGVFAWSLKKEIDDMQNFCKGKVNEINF